MQNPTPVNDDGEYRYRPHVGATTLLSSRKPPQSIGVLAGEDPAAEKTTCTYVIAEKQYPYSKIMGYPSFEKGFEDLKKGAIQTMLVPVAYPRIREFIMDKDILPAETFLCPIPPLVFVTKTLGWDSNLITTLYTHPAPRKLAESLSYIEIRECTSNERVCQELLADTDAFAGGVTNEVAAIHFNLPIRKILHQPNMPWVLFTRV